MSTTPAATPSTHVLPRGPSSPAWWQLVRFAGDPLRLLDECHRRFGDAFTLDIAGNGRFVMLSDPEAVREVFRRRMLQAGEANAAVRRPSGRLGPWCSTRHRTLGSAWVLVPPEGADAGLLRRDAARNARGRAVVADRPGVARPAECGGSPCGHLRTAAGPGLAPGPEMDRFQRKIERFLSNGRQRYALVLMTIIPIDRLSGSRWAPLFRQLSDLDDDLFAFIAKRRRGEHQPGGENVLDDLLAAKHEDGSALEDREVRDITILIMTRHERPGGGLGPGRDRAASGGRRSPGRRAASGHGRRASRGRPPAGSRYLDGAIRESLRLHLPVVPFVDGRRCNPFVVGDREFPPGVVLCPCSYLVHRREELYPEPERFSAPSRPYSLEQEVRPARVVRPLRRRQPGLPGDAVRALRDEGPPGDDLQPGSPGPPRRGEGRRAGRAADRPGAGRRDKVDRSGIYGLALGLVGCRHELSTTRGTRANPKMAPLETA